MQSFLLAVLLYLFPKEVVAKLLIVLLRRIVKATDWTTLDDELLAILEKQVGEDTKDGQNS